MDLRVTEQQKKALTLLITVLIVVMIFTMVIQPLQAKIKANEEKAKVAQQEEDRVRTIVEDMEIEAKYEQLKTESKLTFDQNYQSFKANEKVEEILKNLGITLESLTISPYNAIDAKAYEKQVVQPNTMEEYQAMQATISSEIMKLFLVSNLQITVQATPEQQLQIINAINNIPPEGPGAEQRSRYCMQIPTIVYSEETEGPVSFSINMYGMEPPPIEG